MTGKEWLDILINLVTNTVVIGFATLIISHKLNKRLSDHNSELQKEIEKLKVSESNLHIRKIDKFSEFTDILYGAMRGVKYNKDPKADIQKAMEKFMKDLIFFAGEDTLKKFVEYRNYSHIVKEGGQNEQAKFQFIIAELILEMRKDLGYSNEGINVDHYMHLIVNNWEKHKDEFHERAEKAKKIE